MKTKQPILPSIKFADRRKRKKLITPENQAKMAADEKRRLEKLERDTPKPTNPEYKGLVMAALFVGTDSELGGLVAGLSNIVIEDPAESESNNKSTEK